MESWKRPVATPLNPVTESLSVMCLDIDDYLVGDSPVLRIYGVTQNGNSVLIHVHGFKPYFYIETPSDFEYQTSVETYRAELNDAVFAELRISNFRRRFMNAVISVEEIESQSVWGYNAPLRSYLRITMARPSYISICKRVLPQQTNLFESSLPFPLRYMIDKDLRGGGWFELPMGTYEHILSVDNNVQIELATEFNSIIAHSSVDKNWLKIAPVRILSYDIECAGRKGKFPEAEIDPVIQIANVVVVHGATEPIISNVFVLDTCDPIQGADIHSFATECELLSAWSRFLLEVDPDIITGYNIKGFDFPYLINRAIALQIPDFALLGRLPGEISKITESRFSSKAYGTRDNKDVNISGRIQFDVLPILRREFKLSSYTLNNVSKHFLKNQKEDVHHSIITTLQNGTSTTRKRLAEYCLKDALLPIQLIDKLLLLVNYIEMARVTGVPISYLLTRGQQIKVVSQLYRKARQHNMLIPVFEHKDSQETYEGATVISPVRGYYDETVVTMDFASLYPSIMLAHNLCYSTLVTHEETIGMDPTTYTHTPMACFVKSSMKHGLLPEILDELLSARKNARKDLAQATDPLLRAVLNGRQLALKISANSVYGFTGATVGQLPCLAISSGVTNFGRQMIEMTAQVVQEHYCIANGCSSDARVIYGDTDSVMVCFGTSDVQTAINIGTEAAALVSQHFLNPIKLEFEKVFYPYLLMNKKRYAGLFWTNALKWDKLDTKGIETVRRDNCALVRNTISTCLDKILIDRDPQGALVYAKNVISDLLCNKLDLSLLVITKSLGRTDYVGKQSHVELAKRMHQRDPASAPVTGDRVAYVVKKSSKGTPAYDRTEDPLYVLEHNIPIDTQYYLTNQLSKPLMRIFEPVLGDKVGSLLRGEHTRKIAIQTPSTGGISRFLVRRNTCLKCKTVLSQNRAQEALCVQCVQHAVSLRVSFEEEVCNLEDLYSSLLNKCHTCNGSPPEELITCTSRDCVTFYQRFKAKKDLNEATSKLKRFSTTTHTQ